MFRHLSEYSRLLSAMLRHLAENIRLLSELLRNVSEHILLLSETFHCGGDYFAFGNIPINFGNIPLHIFIKYFIYLNVLSTYLSIKKNL